jgi:hypothetical protein
MAGWQQLFWGDQCVSQINANTDNETFNHQFVLQSDSENTEQIMGEEGLEQSRQLHLSLQGTLQWQPFQLDFQLLINGELIKKIGLMRRISNSAKLRSLAGEHSNSVLLAWQGLV